MDAGSFSLCVAVADLRGFQNYLRLFIAVAISPHSPTRRTVITSSLLRLSTRLLTGVVAVRASKTCQQRCAAEARSSPRHEQES